jgi:hypothetical protein
MLDPPITQADVDEGTVFVRRDKLCAEIRASDNVSVPWADKYRPDIEYDSNGRRCRDAEHRGDLISRLPKPEGEKNAMTQITINVSPPDGYEVTGEYRWPQPNEPFLTSTGTACACHDNDQCGRRQNRIILRKLQGTLSSDQRDALEAFVETINEIKLDLVGELEFDAAMNCRQAVDAIKRALRGDKSL